MTSNTDSIAKRSGVSVIANGARVLIGLLNGILLARWLGPESYGTFAFLTVTFLAVRQLTDLGSSNAFFTFLSARKRSLDFIFILLAMVTDPSTGIDCFNIGGYPKGSFYNHMG